MLPLVYETCSFLLCCHTGTSDSVTWEHLKEGLILLQEEAKDCYGSEDC